MKTLELLTLIIITSCFFACGSDNDEPITNNKRPIKIEGAFSDGYSFTNPITYNGNLLSSYKLIGEGTATVNVNYNSSNKITNLLFTGADWQNTTTYEYNSQGKIETIKDSWGETKFAYNTNGTVQIDAIAFDENGNQSGSQNSILTFENDMLKTISYQRSGEYYKNSFSYDASNNLIAVTKESGSTDGITFTTSTTLNIAYDDNKNPAFEILTNSNALNKGGWCIYNFYNNYNGLKVAYEVGFGNGHYISFYSKNNYISNENYSIINSYTYVYDDMNYPTQLIESGNSDSLQFDYFYEEY